MRDLEEHNRWILSKIVDTEHSTSPKSHSKDLTDMSFNDLHVDKFLGRDAKSRSYYQCTCVCGNITYVRGDLITSGEVKSCGCRLKKHGESETRLFTIWLGMHQRCYNPNNEKYPQYGGRGIKICDKWHKGRNPFVEFRKWAYKNGYSEYYEINRDEYISIDRIDVDDDYRPKNCRFAGRNLQAINRQTTVYLRYDNYVFPISIWAKIVNLSHDVIYGRLSNKWTPAETLTIPNGETRKSNSRIFINVPCEYNYYNKYKEFLNKGLIDPDDPDIWSIKSKNNESEVNCHE